MGPPEGARGGKGAMNEAMMHDLAQRLDRLERTTRRWKWITIGASCLTGCSAELCDP